MKELDVIQAARPQYPHPTQRLNSVNGSGAYITAYNDKGKDLYHLMLSMRKVCREAQGHPEVGI